MSFHCPTDLEYKRATDTGLKNIQMAYCENLDSSYMGSECISKKPVVEYFVFFRKKKVKE